MYKEMSIEELQRRIKFDENVLYSPGMIENWKSKIVQDKDECIKELEIRIKK